MTGNDKKTVGVTFSLRSGLTALESQRVHSACIGTRTALGASLVPPPLEQTSSSHGNTGNLDGRGPSDEPTGINCRQTVSNCSHSGFAHSDAREGGKARISEGDDMSRVWALVNVERHRSLVPTYPHLPHKWTTSPDSGRTDGSSRASRIASPHSGQRGAASGSFLTSICSCPQGVGARHPAGTPRPPPRARVTTAMPA